jgi:hypothetical protein
VRQRPGGLNRSSEPLSAISFPTIAGDARGRALVLISAAR